MGLKNTDLMDFKIPDGMREMTSEEYKIYCPLSDITFGIRNEKNHTNIAILYKKRHILIGRAASLEASLKATEKKMIKMMPSYKNIGYGKKLVDGKEMLTIKFQYEVQGQKQIGKYGLYKSSSYLYGIQYGCGEDYADYAESKFDELLSTVKFNK